MDINKAETPEDEREISLNETSLKKPLDVLDVIGGHGPWQFRQWVVFLLATLCNATVLFSVLFLPSQTYCFAENSTGHPSPLIESSNGSVFPETRNFIAGNQSTHPVVGCNSTNCTINGNNSYPDISLARVFSEKECWNSNVETFAKCSYVVACFLSGLLVYSSAERFGRRPLALISCLFLVGSSFATSWVSTEAIYLILRFISSLGIFAIYLTSAFSLLEYVHEDFKLLYFFTAHLGWGMSHFLLPLFVWLAESWKSFNIIFSVCCLILSFFVWWSPESPSCFKNSGEQTRSRKALKYAAFINGYSTTDVDQLSHNYHLRRESKHDLGTLATPQTKIFCFIYSFILFMISFTTTFLYFAAKWHPEWLKVDPRRMSLSFVGTTEVAATIILLFVTSLVPIKYMWACVSASTSSMLIVIFARNKKGKSSFLLFTVAVFFISAAWTLVLARSFCHKIFCRISKFSLTISAIAVFLGALFASAVVLKETNQVLLLSVAILHLLFGVLTAFLPDYYFGAVS